MAARLFLLAEMGSLTSLGEDERWKSLGQNIALAARSCFALF